MATAIAEDFIVKNGVVVQGTSIVTSSTAQTNALQVSGGAAIAKNLIVGSTSTLGGDLFVSGATYVTGLTATGIVSITSSVTAGAGTGALKVTGGLNVGDNVIISSTLSNTTTIAVNALYVAGGVGIGKTLLVTGQAIFQNDVVFGGQTTYVYSTNTVYTDNLIELHYPTPGPLWTTDDGKDIGLRFHYYKDAADQSGALVLANDTKWLEWYNTGAEGTSTFTGASYGTFKTGSIVLTNTTASNSTNTGALIVGGGVGVNGAVYAGGNISGDTVNVRNLLVPGRLVTVGPGGLLQDTIDIVYNTTTNVLSATVSTATNLAGGATGSLPYQSNTGTTTFLPIGTAGFVLTSNGSAPTWITAGDVTVGYATTASNLMFGANMQIPYQTGSGSTAFEYNLRYDYNADTLHTVNAVFTGTTNASSTISGAVQVVGGIGVGGAVYAGGAITGNTLLVQSTAASTVTNTANALNVNGGAWIGQSLTVAGASTFNGVTTFANNVVFNGTSTFVLSSQTVYTENIIELHRPSLSTSTWTFNDHKDIGLLGDYYDDALAAGKQFFFGFQEATKNFEYYVDGYEDAPGHWIGTYGNLKLAKILLTSTETSTSSVTGALVVPGGVGVNGNVNIQSTGKLTIGSEIASNYLPNVPVQVNGDVNSYFQINSQNINSGTSASTDLVLTANNGNDTSFYLDLGINSSNYADPAFSIVAANDTYLISLSNNLVIANGTSAKNIQFWVDGTTAATGHQILTLRTSGALISATTASVSTNTGALQVVGGVGIGGNLYVGGTTVFEGDTFFYGTNTRIFSTNTVYTDNILELHAPAAGLTTATWTFDDGKDIGIRFHYFANSTDTNAALLLDNTTKYLEWFDSGIDPFPYIANYSTGTYGTFKTGSIILTHTTESTSTTTGALIIDGGIGVGKSVWVGNALHVAGTATISGRVSLTDSTNATNTTDGAVSVTGGISVGQSIVAGGPITAGVTLAATTGTVVPAFYSNNALIASFTSNVLSTTTTATLDFFSSILYRSAKYFVQIVDGVKVHVSEISVFHNGTDAYLSEYGIATSAGQLGVFDAVYGAGNVTLNFTPAVGVTAMTIKMVRTTITL